MRLFLYLDQYKLYSFSSQLFRGLVDHIVNVSETKREREDGPTEREPNATRLVAEIASESSTVAEKRFLHDYAYDRFEDELRFQSALFEVTADATSTDFERSRFVRVSGPAIFADAPRIKDTVSKFNTLIEAFAYVTQSADIRKKLVEAAGDVSGPSDKKAKQLRDALKAVTAKALAEGSRQDDEFLNQLSYLLDFGFRDSLQVQIPFSTTDRQLLFSAVLDRGALRESEHLLLHKYSRLTDRALTVVGVPTQAGGTTAEPFESNDGNIRSAMAGMYSQFSEVEKTFTGRLDGEVIVDPIAIYVQW